jgi:hypothetical protein
MLEEIDSRSNACLAYAVYFFYNSAAEPAEVVWAFSQDLCAENPCGYCRTHNPAAATAGECPGVWEHAQDSFARLRATEGLRDAHLELGAFLVSRGLGAGMLAAEIIRQIRTGTLYAIIA